MSLRAGPGVSSRGHQKHSSHSALTKFRRLGAGMTAVCSTENWLWGRSASNAALQACGGGDAEDCVAVSTCREACILLRRYVSLSNATARRSCVLSLSVVHFCGRDVVEKGGGGLTTMLDAWVQETTPYLIGIPVRGNKRRPHESREILA